MARLFLSHSGSDTAAAIDLKRRLLASPDAQKAGLKIWLDVDDLDTGKPWQAQIEAAIEEAGAFAVVVGSNGIHNWVRAETDIANSRAIKDANFRVIPILQGGGSDLLTPFVKRYQAVRDPLNNPEAMQRLLRAALGLDESGRLILTDEPFPGLRSMSEDWADRFFGRRKETDEVLKLLRRHRAVTIVADSGAGKSSLAQAGVGHAWRGGALMLDRPSVDDPIIWHVVTTRPGENPTEELRNSVETVAQEMGRDAKEQKLFRESLDTDPAFAVRCGLDPNRTRTLLIIDQAEELVTLTSNDRQREFGRLIVRLADVMGDRLRILITLRSTHLGLVARTEGLGPPIAHSEAQFNLKQPVDLAEIVRKPLALTDYGNEDEQEKLIYRLQKDLSDRPGELALAQMTLHLAWRDRKKHGGLLSAYAVNGGARMALGNEAARVEQTLTPEDATRLMPIFIRLIRLSDISIEATRRIASRDEFDADQNRLIDQLAGGDFGSLVRTGAAHVEIAHEALITQWPRLNEYLKTHASALRILSDLMRDAQTWAEADKSAKHLTSLADEERFQWLRQTYSDWLAPIEESMLDWSKREHDRVRKEREDLVRLVRFGIPTLVGLLLGLTALSVFAYKWVQSARNSQELAEVSAAEASVQRALAEDLRTVAEIAETNAAQSRVDALVLLAEARARTDPVAAIKLVMAAWPTEAGQPFPSSVSTLRALEIAFQRTRPHTILRGHRLGVDALAFSPQGELLVSGSRSGTVRIWNMVTMSQDGNQIEAQPGAEITAIAFSPDGSHFVTASSDSVLDVWVTSRASSDGREIPLNGVPKSVAFSDDGYRFAVAYDTGDIEVFRTDLWDSLGVFPLFDRPETIEPKEGEIIMEKENSVVALSFMPRSHDILGGDESGNLAIFPSASDYGAGTFLSRPENQSSGLGILSARAFRSGPDTYVEAAMSDGSLTAWRIGESSPYRREQFSESMWSIAQLGVGGRAVATDSYGGSLWLYDRSLPEQVNNTLEADPEYVSALAISSAGLVASGSGSDGTIHIWRLDDALSLDSYLRRAAGISNEDVFVTVVETSEDGSNLTQFVPLLNPILLACRMLPVRDGQIDADTTDLASEIGVHDTSLPSDCETYAPLRHPDWQ